MDSKEIVVDVLEKHQETVEFEDSTVEIVDEVKLKVITKNNTYFVNCYYAGDYTDDNRDSYVVRVYNGVPTNKNDINWFDEHEISLTDVDSHGWVYDSGLQLEDKDVDKAIMDILFGEKPLIKAF